MRKVRRSLEIGCIVKAAGKSQRFGTSDKLLSTLHGKPLLKYVLDALPKEIEYLGGTVSVKIRAVVSSGETECLCESCGIKTLRYSGGPVSETIHIGLSALLETDGCMFVSGDQPLCGRNSYIKIITEFLKNPGSIVRLSFGGIAGSPVLFPRRLYPDLMALKGERGGMSAVGDGETVLLVDAENEAELLDADTVEALRSLEKLIDNQCKSIFN